MGDPEVRGASVPNPVQGMSLNKASFKFTVGKRANHAFCCGFPTHALSGHWVVERAGRCEDSQTLKVGDVARGGREVKQEPPLRWNGRRFRYRNPPPGNVGWGRVRWEPPQRVDQSRVTGEFRRPWWSSCRASPSPEFGSGSGAVDVVEGDLGG